MTTIAIKSESGSKSNPGVTVSCPPESAVERTVGGSSMKETFILNAQNL